MGKKKSVFFWVLLGIVIIICFALAFHMVKEDEDFAENANLDSSEDSNADYLDFSGHYARTGYYLKDGDGIPCILEEDGEGYLIRLDTMEDSHMFSELMSGDVIMIASDEGMDAVDPPSIGAYARIASHSYTMSQ